MRAFARQFVRCRTHSPSLQTHADTDDFVKHLVGLARRAGQRHKAVANGKQSEEQVLHLAADAAARLRDLPERQVIPVLWALAKLDSGLQQLKTETEREQLDQIRAQAIRVAESSVQAWTTPRDLSRAAWACATLGGAAAAPVVRSMACLATQQQDGSKHGGSMEWVPHDVTQMAWSMAKVLHRDDCLLRSLGRLASQNLEAFDSQHFANLLWSFAALRATDHHLFEAIVDACTRRVVSFGPQELANTLWSFATLAYRAPKLETELAQEIQRRRSTLESQHIANALWATAKLGNDESGVFPVLCGEAASRSTDFSAEHLSMIFWAMASIEEVDKSRTCKRMGYYNKHVLDKLSQRVSDTLDDFQPAGLASTSWAFASLLW
eukprot:TRINITY_DN21126_c0_g1_i2.p1 TRINITY_DN21126_c0_g1~~TRINITY_DN21126_c0_g1_i2.p1  ORF type:complete len:380 (-),score=60.12 TRINITY_DN21126_c0_g1_i2:231-1370(-)